MINKHTIKSRYRIFYYWLIVLFTVYLTLHVNLSITSVCLIKTCNLCLHLLHQKMMTHQIAILAYKLHLCICEYNLFAYFFVLLKVMAIPLMSIQEKLNFFCLQNNKQYIKLWLLQMHKVIFMPNLCVCVCVRCSYCYWYLF